MKRLVMVFTSYQCELLLEGWMGEGMQWVDGGKNEMGGLERKGNGIQGREWRGMDIRSTKV